MIAERAAAEGCSRRPSELPAKEFDVCAPLRRLQMKSKLHLGFADLFGETRWLGDLISFTLHGLFRRTNPSARSHGCGVLLIPGFLSGDYSLNPLGARLAALGYRIFFSGIWYNVDCPVHTLPRLEKVLRKASVGFLIWWSGRYCWAHR